MKHMVVLFLCLCLSCIGVSVRAQTIDVAGTFDFGFVGEVGNGNRTNNIVNFTTLGVDISLFVFSDEGYAGSQGNDIGGFLRLVAFDGQLVNISGAINWQVRTQGTTRYIGLRPDPNMAPITINLPGGGTFTFDGSQRFGVRVPGETLVFADGSNVNGNASAPDLSGIPIETFPDNPGSPPLLASSDAVSVLEGTTTPVKTFTTNEFVSWSVSGPDAALFSINPVTGVLVFNNPPSFSLPLDQGADNIYTLTITALDGEGLSATQVFTVTVTPVVANITATKTVSPVSVLGQPFDCLSSASVAAELFLPGVCVEYVVVVVNAAVESFPAQNLVVVDSVPNDLTAIGIIEQTGFDSVVLSAGQVTAQAASFNPGESASFTVRALIQ